MVRAGERGRLFDVFREKGVVAIGWGKLGDVSLLKEKDAVTAAIKKNWPDWKFGHVINSAGTLHRFAFEMSEGDRVLTYDPSRRAYLVGTITGPYQYSPGVIEDLENVRKVSWNADVVERDDLPLSSRNTLGSALTLFWVPPEVAETIEKAMRGEAARQVDRPSEELADESDLEVSALEDSEERAKELIKDRISKLSWQQM